MVSSKRSTVNSTSKKPKHSGSGARKIRALSNQRFRELFTDRLAVQSVELSNLKGLGKWLKCVWTAKDLKNFDIYIAFNATSVDCICAVLSKRLWRNPTKIVFYDMILHQPGDLFDKLKETFRAWMLKSVDKFICVHKDTTGYQKVFKIPEYKFHYIPFKANNYERLDTYVITDEGYVWSGGASHRDYGTLCEAAKSFDYPVEILVPSYKIARGHGTSFYDSDLPNNVRVRKDIYGKGWSQSMAGARIVVVPVIPGVLQSAGISVCLQAMALGKAVIISEGTSTRGILSKDLVELVQAGSAKELSEAIRRLWTDGTYRNKLGERGREFALSLGGETRVSRDIQNYIASYGEEARTGDG